MSIRIPDFMFAHTTGQVTPPGEVTSEIRNALATAQSVEKEMAALNRGVTLAGEALAGGDKVQQRLLAARNALGTMGNSGALRWLLDHAAAEHSKREDLASSRSAMRTLVTTIKAVGGLPIPFEMKAELGRHVVQQALRARLVQPEDQGPFEAAALSQFGLQKAQQEIAKADKPGQALTIVEDVKAEGQLLPNDIALLDQQAKVRDEVATARHRAKLAWKEQDDLAAFARGEQPEPLSEESFRLIHGAQGALGAYTRYQAARHEGVALEQIRGKTPAAIAQAEDAWQGDPTAFVSARSKDAAERQRDPVAYVIATQPGLQEALKKAPPEERLWLLWQAQADVGIPEDERAIWSRAEQETLSDEWAAIPTDSSGATARLDFLRMHVQSLPLAVRGAAIRTLVRQGITDGTEAELTHVVAELDDNRSNPARKLAAELTPAGTAVGDGGNGSNLVSSAPMAATEAAEPATTPAEPIDWHSRGLPDAGAEGAWKVPAYEYGRQAAIDETLNHILALEHDPARLVNLAKVEQEIRECFAGDDGAIDFFIRRARILARAEDDDALSGDDWRRAARESVIEARERVIAGEPYDERWAEMRPTLAKLESETGLYFRPGAGPGLLGVLEPGREESLFSLPLPLARILADSPEALMDFARLPAALLRGGDIDAVLDALAPKFIETTEYTDRSGKHHKFINTEAFDEIKEAVYGAQARLQEGAAPDEVFLHLMQVVLKDELDDTDLAVVALETVLEFVPAYQYVEMGRSVADLVAALKAGDADAAWAAGIGTALATIGSFPVLGPFAKSGLRWVARAFRWLPTPAKRSLDWLTRKASGVAEKLDIWEQKLWYAFEGERKRMYRYLNGRPDSQGFQWEMVEGSPAFNALPPHEQARYKSLWGDMNDRRGKSGELDMVRLSDSLEMYSGTVRTTRETHILVTRRNGKTSSLPLDVARFPANSQLLRDINAGLIGTKTSPLTPQQFVAANGFALELKTGAADVKGVQALLRNQLILTGNKAGRNDVWFKAHMPNRELPLADHIAAVRTSAQKLGFSDEMVRSLVMEVRNNTPHSWPTVLTIATTEMLLLQMYLKMQSTNEEQ